MISERHLTCETMRDKLPISTLKDKSMDYNKKFCVYLTCYSGNKLPPFYMGSTKTVNIFKGYRGSISSKKYKKIFNEELSTKPDLFSVEILFTFDDRVAALSRELELQKENDVVNSKWFFNESLASPNGYFGRDVSGENNPAFGKRYRKVEDRSVYGAAKGTIWMNNGYRNVRIKLEKLNEAIEQGFFVGYIKGTTNLNRRGIKFKKTWAGKYKMITDGNINKKILVSEQVPDGWYPGSCLSGKKFKVSKKETKKCITNGKESRRIPVSQDIPEGWFPGRHYDPKG